jgi:hypothetical protein
MSDRAQTNWTGVVQISNRWRDAAQFSFAAAMFPFLGFASLALLALAIAPEPRLNTFWAFIIAGTILGLFGFVLSFTLIGTDIILKRPRFGSLDTLDNKVVTAKIAQEIAERAAAGAISDALSGSHIPHRFQNASGAQDLQEGNLSISDTGLDGFLTYPWKDISGIQNNKDMSVTFYVRKRLFGIPFVTHHPIRIGFSSGPESDSFFEAIHEHVLQRTN